MDSFLSGRATVTKLKPAGDRSFASGDEFSPMFDARADKPATSSEPANGSSTPAGNFPLLQNAPNAAESTSHTHEVKVEVVRHDGAVRSIVVTCRCGERIELDCVY